MADQRLTSTPTQTEEAELPVDLLHRPDEDRTSALLFAAPVDRLMGFGHGVGVQLRVDGEEVDRLEVWRDEQE